jgi:hypothetical protein
MKKTSKNTSRDKTLRGLSLTRAKMLLEMANIVSDINKRIPEADASGTSRLRKDLFRAIRRMHAELNKPNG